MSNPVILLFVLLAIIALFVVIVIFKNPIGRYWNKVILKRERILVEDALKHLYDYEYKGLMPTLNSLAGALSISVSKADKLIEKLVDMGLLKYSDDKIELTPDGRVYALKVVRIHRLWERYLAEETSVPDTQWHNEAEVREHQLTEAEAEELAARLGNPLVDPHGDPIPSAKGEMPESKNITLAELEEGDYGRVVHVEDEPQEVYEQISAFNILPGVQIHVIKKDEKKIIFDADGQEGMLALRFARNVNIIKLTSEEIKRERFQILSELELNQEAEIVGISKSLIGQQRRRLLDFGFVPGTKIRAVLRAAGGDPTAYLLHDTIVALREDIANKIFIKPEADGGK